ncbi:hypothetical protein DXG03_002083, partial [Asterophora parasitica]
VFALASRSCAAQARKHIFRSVRFQDFATHPRWAYQRHQEFLAMIARDQAMAFNVQEVVVHDQASSDMSPQAVAARWIQQDVSFHNTLRELASRNLRRFTLECNLQWTTFPLSLRYALRSIYASGRLQFLFLHNLRFVPKSSCILFGKCVPHLNFVNVEFIDASDPELPPVRFQQGAVGLRNLGFERIPQSSLEVLKDSLITPPQMGAVLPSLHTLHVGPIGRHIPPFNTIPIKLSVLRSLTTMSFEVNYYTDNDPNIDIDDDEDLDSFRGLLNLLSTAEPANGLEILRLKVHYADISEALDDLITAGESSSYSRLDRVLSRDNFRYFRRLRDFRLEVDFVSGLMREEVEHRFRERDVNFDYRMRDIRGHVIGRMPNMRIRGLRFSFFLREMKSSRTGLNKAIAVPPSYNAFFSFPVQKSGYSGAGTYVRTSSAVPVKAEEGLCGILHPKPPLSAEERVSGLKAYPQGVIADEYDSDDREEEAGLDYKDLDSEGRTLVLDFGLFVLINVYCPNGGNGTEERDKYKADFHRVLEARVKGLVEEGREVMVVGDLNACSAVIDHCEGHLMVAKGLAEGLQGEDGFWGKDVRRWLRAWMVAEDGTGGPMIDITRRFWPDRKAMYTCACALTSIYMAAHYGPTGWNTKISARESNYGTRIDYMLITRGLLPWIKASDIQPQVKGSDHCPVYLDLHDELVDSSGVVVKLRDAMGFKSEAPLEPPRIASKFWDEYSGKQRLLQQFFGKNTAPSSSARAPSVPKPVERSGDLDSTTPSSSRDLSRDPSTTEHGRSSPAPLALTQPSGPSSSTNSATSSSSSTAVKRKLTADTLSNSSSKKQKQKKEQEKNPGQAKLSSFFAKPKNSTALPAVASSSNSKSISRRHPDAHRAIPAEVEIIDVDLEADHRLAVLLSQEDGGSHRCANEAEAKQAWSSLLAPMQAPRCTVHDQPTKELTVTKPGPNKGKKFFICAR